MTEIEHCERCHGELGEASYQVQMDSGLQGEGSEPLVSMKVCDHCRKSFLGWVARQKKSSSSRTSSSPASSEGVGGPSESRPRSRGHSESSKSNRRFSSGGSSLSSPDDIFDAPITLPIPSAGKLFESAKEGLHSALEAATSGMTNQSPQSGRYEDMESPANYLVTIGMVLGIFAAIGILLSYIIG